MNESDIDRTRRLANDRQKRFYKANSERLKQTRQAERNELIKFREKAEVAVPLPNVVIAQINNFNEENIVNGLNSLTINEKTKKKKIKEVKTIFRITACENLGGCLKTFNKIKKSIEEAKQVRFAEKAYATNSKTGLVQCILFCIDIFNIPMKPEVLKKYEQWYAELQIKSKDELELRKLDPEHAVLPYSTYLNKILTKFGVDSKEYLIASLYDQVTCRDNFGNLEIIPSMRTNDNTTQNYLIVPRSKTAKYKIVIQTYKTMRLYGVMTITLTAGLTELIKKYIEKHKLTTHLFHVKNGLSGFITAMNKKIEVKGSINYIRHSKVSEFLENPDLTPEQKLEFATACMHSPLTQIDYKRLLK